MQEGIVATPIWATPRLASLEMDYQVAFLLIWLAIAQRRREHPRTKRLINSLDRLVDLEDEHAVTVVVDVRWKLRAAVIEKVGVLDHFITVYVTQKRPGLCVNTDFISVRLGAGDGIELNALCGSARNRARADFANY